MYELGSPDIRALSGCVFVGDLTPARLWRADPLLKEREPYLTDATKAFAWTCGELFHLQAYLLQIYAECLR